jgi:hypothetical protein
VARQNDISHFRNTKGICRNYLLSIMDFTGCAKQLVEMWAKIIAVDDVGLT